VTGSFLGPSAQVPPGATVTDALVPASQWSVSELFDA